MIPSIDNHSLDELKNIVEEMVEEDRQEFENKEGEDGQIDSSKNQGKPEGQQARGGR